MGNRLTKRFGNLQPIRNKKVKQKNLITNTQNLTGDRIIHTFRGQVSNIYIIEDNLQKASFLVDCGMPSDAAVLAKSLHGLPPLKRVVCTHFHVDHVSGWRILKRHYKGCDIWFHERAKFIIKGDERLPYPSFNDMVTIFLPCMREAGYSPSIGDLFKGGLYGTPFKRGFPSDRVKYFSSEQPVLPGFRTIHTPGHRPDSVSFFDRDGGILISGDFLLVINGELIDNTFLSSEEEQKASIDKIRGMDRIKHIFPGHGISLPFSKTDL